MRKSLAAVLLCVAVAAFSGCATYEKRSSPGCLFKGLWWGVEKLFVIRN